jgi:hypothetical protein
MAPPLLRFQTEGLSRRIIQENSRSGERQDSIQKLEKRFESVGIGKSEIVYMRLYPNQCDLVNQNLGFRHLVISLQYMQNPKSQDSWFLLLYLQLKPICD